MIQFNRLFFIFSILSLTACGPQTSGLEITRLSQVCDAGTAQIAIFDGFQKRICGCAEADNTIIGPEVTLTCSVATGTTVFFHFVGTTQPHQIQSSGSPAFLSSPVSSSLISKTTKAFSYGVKLDTAGTYSFVDTYSAATSGQIIVF